MNKCSNLSELEIGQVNEILKGNGSIKINKLVNGYGRNVQNALHKIYDSFDYLTVAEYAIWSARSICSVYRDIYKGIVVAERTAGPGSKYRINMEKTKLKLKNIN